MKGTIVYYGNFELPDKGASANRVVSNGKIFSRLGYRVVFLGTNMMSDYFDGIKQTSFDNCMFEECYPTSTKQWIRYVFDASNVLDLFVAFDDIVLVIAYNLPYAKFKNLKKLMKCKKIPVAYDCTEWNDYAEGNILKRWYKKLDLHQIKHQLTKQADGMIVISKMMEKAYRHKIMVRIPPLVDISDPIWHQTIEKNSSRFEFCYAGAVGVKEALDVTIKAFCRLENEQTYLRIIGLTKQEVKAIYPDLDNYADNERIIYMGLLSHEETVMYVQNSDCYVFLRYDNPRNQAGFPTKFVEAYSCGVPIITTDVSDIGEYMKDECDGTLLKSPKEELIKQAMENRSAFVHVNRETKKDFDYNVYIDMTSAWLNQIINRRMSDGEKR